MQKLVYPRCKDKWFIAIVLMCWVWMNLWVALRYEPWRDMAQSWMIARQLSLPDLFAQLKYEGHPCLWFLLLIPMTKLGMPFYSIIGLSFSFVFAGLWLFLRAAPLAKLEKTIVVFSAAGMYYLPIASRSYSLLPLLFMLLYMAYPKRYSHPLRYAVILFLLCQVHVLLCGLIGVLMLQWTAGAIRVYQQEKAKRAMLAAWLLMIGTVVFLFWQLSGCVNTNELVSVRAVTALSELRHPVLKAISMGSWFLTTIHLYDYGNTVWWLVLAPLILAFFALLLIWLWRAPRSASALIIAFLFQLGIHTMMYSAHMQHMLTFLWACLLCVFLAQNELKDKPQKRKRKIDDVLARAMTVMVIALCLMTCAQVYPAMRDQCSDKGINSDASAAANYIMSQLPADAVVLVDSEEKASPVAAFCADGKLYNPARNNDHIFALHDSLSSGWCTFGKLDAEVSCLRASGKNGELFLLADVQAEAAAKTMSDQSACKLELIRRFVSDGAYEQYLLYRIVE